ncbi:SPOR domain-containing protein [Gloeomargarita sp.]
MATPTEQTTLLAALACLDIDLERELQQLRQERANWEPEWWRSLLGPTPPPASAWTFPAAANAPPVATDGAAPEEGEVSAPLAIPEPPPTTALAVAELPEGGADGHKAGEDTASVPDAATALPPLRPSWSERLNRVFARRQAAAEPLGDPWAETFVEPPRPASFRLSQPVLGFALGVTAATLGTWAILGLRQPPRPTPTTPALRVPAPPPEGAVLPTPSPSPVPNLARRELPDLSAIPTASPRTSPTPSPPNLGFYYVVTDYHNEQSLLAAQKVVPEAFVWQFPHGVKVQLAAFELREQAEQFVANLKAKGINARVYP